MPERNPVRYDFGFWIADLKTLGILGTLDHFSHLILQKAFANVRILLRPKREAL